MSVANFLLAATKNMILNHGQVLPVSRRDGTSQNVRFLPEPLADGDIINLRVEAGINVSNQNAYDFVTSGDMDIREAVDTIAYGGSNYQIVNVNPQVESGVQITLHCVGTRR